MKKYLLLGLSLILGATLWAQERTVTGTVTDSETGESVPGANVVVKGTTNGTITDFDGKYQISVGQDAVLMFTFVGYNPTEVAVGNRSVVNVGLELDVEELAEVVVVGYGSQQKKEITSSVVALDEEQFNKGNVNDPTQLLQGKVPGLSVYNKGGDPNGSATIRLRGISTVGANTEPLVVVDGVIGASLQNVDPNDIESINVLKDGSAAAIYGSRGSSGVILVTTKRGKRGSGINANYNGYVAAATIARELPALSASEYLAAGGNDLGSNTNWLDEVTRTGYTQVHNISVSGGAENTTFRLSTNIRDVNGILNKSGFDQINARAGITHYALNDRLKIDFNMSLTNRESNFSFNEALRYASLYNPTAPIYFDNGSFFQAVLFDNFNPVAMIEQNQNVGKRKNLNFNMQGEYSITDALSVTANYAQQYTNNLNGQFYPSTSFFRGQRNGRAQRFTDDSRFTLFETYATYAGSFGDIDLSVSGGYSYQENFYENLSIELENFPTNSLGFYGLDLSYDRVLGVASNVNITSDATPEERIIAFFGRVNLNYDDGIFFNASVRREGSTKLGADNQWGVFPAVGLGVDLNKYLGISGFSVLKLRGGYGVTGALPSASGQSQDSYTYDVTAGGGTVSYARAANPDLKWEDKAETNLGIDFGVMQGRFNGSIDVYTRNITDFILLRNVDPGVYGASQRYENVGSLKTNGAEVALNYDVLQGADLSWTTGIVASTYKSTLEEYTNDEQSLANLGSPGQNSTPMVRVAVGEEIGQIWGPVFDGVDENGSPVFKDLNGDGTINGDPGSALADDGDFQKLGSGLPTLELGWSNQLTYKRFDFNVFFRAAFGHSLVNTFRAFYEPIDPGAINSYNRIVTDKAVDGLTGAQYSSLYVEKADFFRLDNATVGYNLNVGDSKAFKSARLYFSVQNAFTITGYSGLDPDPVLLDVGPTDNGGYVDPANRSVLAPGIDRRNNYFTARTFTLGLNLGF